MNKILISLIAFTASTSVAEQCLYTINENSVKMSWTGFKYTDRAAVGGTFDDVSFTQKSSDSLSKLFKSLAFEINTDSVNSGNPARDATLKKTIFSFLKVPQKITGTVTSATDDTINFNLLMNEETPLKTQVAKKDKKLVVSGSLDLLQNNLLKSFNAIHKACEGLHTGKDGISKTWPYVEIKIEADYEEKCSKGLMDSIKSWFS